MATKCLFEGKFLTTREIHILISFYRTLVMLITDEQLFSLSPLATFMNTQCQKENEDD